MKAGAKELYTGHELKEEKKNKRTAAITTALFYLGVLLLFIFLGFRTPLPLPGEEGDIVLLGLEADGDNPENDFSEGESEEHENRESYTPPTETTPQPVQPDPTPETDPTPDEQLTSDDPDAPEVEAKPTTPKEQPKPEEPVEPKKEEPKEEQPKVSDEDLFKKGGSKGDGGNNPNSANTGGDPDGQPDAAKSGKSGQSEKGGEGFSFDLDGRSVVKSPSRIEDVQKKGRVVVEIRVDTEGKVVHARAGMRGSTTTDSRLLQLAQKAAYETRFSRAPNHIVGEQTGQIIIEFRLD